MKIERQKTIKRLDKLFSEYIRKRAWQRCGGCEREKYVDKHELVRRWQDLDCAHFKSRKKYSTRWHEDNAAGLCGGCHFYLDANKEEKDNFFKELLGEQDFNNLNMRAEYLITHKDPMDYNLIEIYLKQKIKELEEK